MTLREASGKLNDALKSILAVMKKKGDLQFSFSKDPNNALVCTASLTNRVTKFNRVVGGLVTTGPPPVNLVAGSSLQIGSRVVVDIMMFGALDRTRPNYMQRSQRAPHSNTADVNKIHGRKPRQIICEDEDDNDDDDDNEAAHARDREYNNSESTASEGGENGRSAIVTHVSDESACDENPRSSSSNTSSNSSSSVSTSTNSSTNVAHEAKDNSPNQASDENRSNSSSIDTTASVTQEPASRNDSSGANETVVIATPKMQSKTTPSVQGSTSCSSVSSVSGIVTSTGWGSQPSDFKFLDIDGTWEVNEATFLTHYVRISAQMMLHQDELEQLCREFFFLGVRQGHVIAAGGWGNYLKDFCKSLRQSIVSKLISAQIYATAHELNTSHGPNTIVLDPDHEVTKKAIKARFPEDGQRLQKKLKKLYDAGKTVNQIVWNIAQSVVEIFHELNRWMHVRAKYKPPSRAVLLENIHLLRGDAGVLETIKQANLEDILDIDYSIEQVSILDKRATHFVVEPRNVQNTPYKDGRTTKFWTRKKQTKVLKGEAIKEEEASEKQRTDGEDTLSGSVSTYPNPKRKIGLNSPTSTAKKHRTSESHSVDRAFTANEEQDSLPPQDSLTHDQETSPPRPGNFSSRPGDFWSSARKFRFVITCISSMML